MSEIKPIRGYLHVATMYGGNLIASEIHGRLKQSGLYDITESIKVVILGPKKDVDFLREFIFDRNYKYHIVYESENYKEFEWPSLNTIKIDADQSTEDYNIWYLHTKGASNCRSDVIPRIQNNIRDWRDLLSYYVIGKYETCLKILNNGANAVGPLKWVDTDNHIPYFMGNWWWVTSKHVRSLKPIDLSEIRNMAEGWIGSALIDNHDSLVSLCKAPCLDLYDFSNIWGDQGPLHKTRWPSLE